mgnify:CR=1 FL=1
MVVTSIGTGDLFGGRRRLNFGGFGAEDIPLNTLTTLATLTKLDGTEWSLSSDYCIDNVVVASGSGTSWACMKSHGVPLKRRHL